MTVNTVKVNPIPAGGIISPRYPVEQTIPTIPTGGIAGQALVKSSGTDYDTDWGTISGGSGGGGAGGLVPLSEIVVSVAQASLNFPTIPANYRDLVIVLRGRGTKSAVTTTITARVNNDSSAIYDYERIEANHTSQFNTGAVAQTAWQLGYLPAATAPSGVGSVCKFEIYDYAGTTLHKSMAVTAAGAKASTGAPATTDLYADRYTGWYRSLTAISRVELFCDSGNFDVGTVATLYGVAGGAGAAGNAIQAGGLPVIFDQILGAAAASIPITLPNTYNDFLIVVSGRGTAAATNVEVRLQFNADTGNNYDWEAGGGNGSGTFSTGAAGVASMQLGWLPGASAPANVGGSTEISILNYQGAVFQKSAIGRSNLKQANVLGNLYAGIFSGWWRNVAPITAALLILNSGNYDVGTRVTVYGIGGSTVLAVTPDSPPASPNNADDEWESATLDTTGTRRASATPWSWDNQGSATAILTRGRLILSCVGDGSGNYKTHNIYQALPSGDGTYETEFRLYGLGGSWTAGGLWLRESATNKRLVLVKGIDTSAKIQVRRMTDAVTWTANPYNSSSDEALSWQQFYAKFVRAGAIITLYLGGDGADFASRYSFTQTTEFTTAPDQIGLSIGVSNAEVGRLTSGWWRKTG